MRPRDLVLETSCTFNAAHSASRQRTASGRARVQTGSLNMALYSLTGRANSPFHAEPTQPRLTRASSIQRAYAELSPSGYGIHWPLIDEDLAVAPLLRTSTARGFIKLPTRVRRERSLVHDVLPLAQAYAGGATFV